MAEASKAIVTIAPQGGAITRLEFSAEQRQMIRDTIAPQASEQEFTMLMEVASLRRLNPLLKQIHFVPRWSKKLSRYTWSFQVSIDGFRLIADRTGQYDGQDEAEIERDKAGIALARVRVYRKGISRPFVGVAHWAEYVQKGKDGDISDFWKRMPNVMISKCAEAIALRKAFPEDLSGFYVPEEMAQADNEVDVTPRAGADLEEKLKQTLALNAKRTVPVTVPQEKAAAKHLAEQAEIMGGEVVVPEEARGSTAFAMPFASKNGHWEEGAPIESLSEDDLKNLADWKPKKSSKVPAAAAAELARRAEDQP
jgi:phage recombination protein Bet